MMDRDTFPQTNILVAPENGWLEYQIYQFPFGMVYFQVLS